MSLLTGTIILIAIFTFTGALAVIAAIAGWNWFFNSSNARMLTGRLSFRNARIVYFILGTAILSMAAYMAYSLQ